MCCEPKYKLDVVNSKFLANSENVFHNFIPLVFVNDWGGQYSISNVTPEWFEELCRQFPEIKWIDSMFRSNAQVCGTIIDRTSNEEQQDGAFEENVQNIVSEIIWQFDSHTTGTFELIKTDEEADPNPLYGFIGDIAANEIDFTEPVIFTYEQFKNLWLSPGTNSNYSIIVRWTDTANNYGPANKSLPYPLTEIVSLVESLDSESYINAVKVDIPNDMALLVLKKRD